MSATYDFEGAPPTGRVTSTISHGELFLHPEGDPSRTYRLRWLRSEDTRARPLPVGTYRVRGYRHVRAAADGSTWIWSTSSPSFREIEVTEGETTHCPVRRQIAVKTRAVFRKGTHRIGVAFEAEKGLGHTLYQDGRRIDIRWQCLDEKGAVLSEGAMRYG